MGVLDLINKKRTIDIIREFEEFKKKSISCDISSFIIIKSTKKCGDDYMYAVSFPLTNNEWTITAFDFLKQYTHDYWIGASASYQDYFDIPLTGRFPFVLFSKKRPS